MIPNRHMIGHIRRALEQPIQDAILGGAICFLTGPPGAGKTTLCQRLIDSLSRGGHHTFLFDVSAATDIQHPSGVWAAELAAELCTTLERGRCRSERILGILSDQCGQSIVLAFDEVISIAGISPILELQRELSAQPHPRADVCLIFCGTLSEFEIGRLPIAPRATFWSQDFDAAELAAAFDAPRTVLNQIFQWTGGMPIAVHHIWLLLQQAQASDAGPTVDEAAASLRDAYVQSGIVEWVERYLRSATECELRSALAVYAALLRGESLEAEPWGPREELLALAGLIERRRGARQLRLRSDLFRYIFDKVWLERLIARI